MKHIVSFSGGKDSSAMLIRMVEEGMPIEDIVFINVMATDTVSAELPEMAAYIRRMEQYIKRKITIVPSVHTFDEIFHQKYRMGKKSGRYMAFPIRLAHGAMTVLNYKPSGGITGDTGIISVI